VTGGRRAYAALARLHLKLSEFNVRPSAVDEAIELLDQELNDASASAARAIVASEAAEQADRLDDAALDFLLRHLDLLDDTAVSRHAGAIGRSVWSRDPARIVPMLDAGGPAKLIADHTLIALPIAELIRGLVHDEALVSPVLTRRPEIVADREYWLVRGAVRPEALEAAQASNQLSAALAAMIQSGRDDLARFAGDRFGVGSLWPSLAIEMNRADLAGLRALAPWLAVAAADTNVTARVLANAELRTRAALVALARATAPDGVPNDFGDDPWVLAVRSAKDALGDQDATFFAAYLLSRALGPRSQNSAGLAVLAFDTLYRAVAADRVSDDAWHLVDPRLPSSFFWFDWDRCQRLRAGLANLFIERNLAPGVFGQVTVDDALFGALAEEVAKTSRGRRYLRRVRHALKDADVSRFSRRVRAIEKLTGW
jgi:hypothetical protein